MSVTIEIFILSLAPTGERASLLSKRLKSFGCEFQFIDAVDGRQLDLSTCPDYDADHARNYMGRSLVGGEIGCYLSHLRAAQSFLISDADYAIVLEDDSAPSSSLMRSAQDIALALNQVDPDWLLVNLGKSSGKLNSDITTIEQGAKTVQAAHYFPITTHGLLWSRKGAERFVREYDKIWAPVDNYFRHWLTRAGHGYAVNPPLVDVTGVESEITQTANASKRQYEGRAWFFQLSKQKRLLIDKIIASLNKKRFIRAQLGPSASPAE